LILVFFSGCEELGDAFLSMPTRGEAINFNNNNEAEPSFFAKTKSCKPKDWFYGLLPTNAVGASKSKGGGGRKINKDEEKIFIDRNLENFLRKSFPNNPKRIRNLKRKELGFKSILITGRQSGSTSTKFSVGWSTYDESNDISFRINNVEEAAGLAVMTWPFWAAKIPDYCKTSLR
jgi:hypothetical protein